MFMCFQDCDAECEGGSLTCHKNFSYSWSKLTIPHLCLKTFFLSKFNIPLPPLRHQRQRVVYRDGWVGALLSITLRIIPSVIWMVCCNSCLFKSPLQRQQNLIAEFAASGFGLLKACD